MSNETADNRINKTSGRTVAIVLAAGSGRRMHSDVAKQFLLLNDRPILCYSLDTFEQSDYIDEVILVTSPDGMETCEEIVKQNGYKKVKSIVLGGKERYHSVWNGLKAMITSRYSRAKATCTSLRVLTLRFSLPFSPSFSKPRKS